MPPRSQRSGAPENWENRRGFPIFPSGQETPLKRRSDSQLQSDWTACFAGPLRITGGEGCISASIPRTEPGVRFNQ